MAAVNAPVNWPVYPSWLPTAVLWAALGWFVVLIAAILIVLVRNR